MFDSGSLGKLGMLKRGLGVVSRGNQVDLVGRKSWVGSVLGVLPWVGLVWVWGEEFALGVVVVVLRFVGWVGERWCLVSRFWVVGLDYMWDGVGNLKPGVLYGEVSRHGGNLFQIGGGS